VQVEGAKEVTEAMVRNIVQDMGQQLLQAIERRPDPLAANAAAAAAPRRGLDLDDEANEFLWFWWTAPGTDQRTAHRVPEGFQFPSYVFCFVFLFCFLFCFFVVVYEANHNHGFL
jgi:hypothetical protein